MHDDVSISWESASCFRPGLESGHLLPARKSPKTNNISTWSDLAHPLLKDRELRYIQVYSEMQNMRTLGAANQKHGTTEHSWSSGALGGGGKS